MNARINSFKIFQEVSEDIYLKINKEKPNSTFDYIIAFTVNCALACELGMKAIAAEHYIELKGHNLSDLFNKLEAEEQSFIKSKMPSLVDKSDNSKEFDNYIKVVATNFVDWRYFYEKGMQTNWLFLHELMNAIDLFFDGHS